MVLKLAGGLLVIGSCTGLGLSLSAGWRERRRLLEELRKMIFMLKGEILYGNSTLMEAFGQVGTKCQGPLAALFYQVSEGIEHQCGEPFYEIWGEQIEKLDKKLALTEKDRKQLSAFGEHLGYLDRDMQERTMLLFLEELDMTISYLRENQAEKCRLYTSMGIMGGLFLTILLC